MSKRKSHKTAVAIVLLVVVAAAGYGVFRLLTARPLTGTYSHDFGLVAFDEPPVTVEHTFELRNGTGGTIAVNRVKPSCGCTTADPSTRSVEPGAVLELATSLRLERAGTKKANIKLFLEIDGQEVIQTLFVQGTGRPSRTLSAGLTEMILASDQPSMVLLTTLMLDSNDKPPPPSLTVPSGYTATFDEWTRRTFVDRGKKTPARWQGRVTVTGGNGNGNGDANTDAGAGGDMLVVNMPDGQRVEITLRR